MDCGQKLPKGRRQSESAIIIVVAAVRYECRLPPINRVCILRFEFEIETRVEEIEMLPMDIRFLNWRGEVGILESTPFRVNGPAQRGMIGYYHNMDTERVNSQQLQINAPAHIYKRKKSHALT
mmetsp:Transcript_18643/g.39063  ORF Transcript_18643/g.39063 Transcript_18643/m.39063 type:complete len:123 (+) Transcript_18643:319-687(+)